MTPYLVGLSSKITKGNNKVKTNVLAEAVIEYGGDILMKRMKV